MRFKGIVALVVSVTMTVLMTAGAQSAVADTGASGTVSASSPPASCDAPPSTPDATQSNRDRFVQLWAPRVEDNAWLQHFASLDAVPQDILDEGFHSMDKDTQAWLVACLVANLVAVSGQPASDSKITNFQIGLDVVIFGKAQIDTAREQLNKTAQPTDTPAPPQNLTQQHLDTTSHQLASEPSLTSASLPKADVSAPQTKNSSDFVGQTSARVQSYLGAPTSTPNVSVAGKSTSVPATQSVDPNALLKSLTGLNGVLTTPLVAFILQAIQDLLQLIAKIQQVLFTIPGVNLLASAFYRVCAESATQPLACSIYLPVGVPNLVDVTGDNFPDMTVDLTPLINGSSVGAQVYMAKLLTATGPLPAHVFIVYDTPLVKKRIEFGFDGRASTLAKQTTTTVYLKNVLKALTGDIDVTANITNHQPGSTESITFAVKDLVGGSLGVAPTEANPMAGAVQMSPFPDTIQAEAHLTHTSAQDEDIVNLQTSVPTLVNATIDQDTTTAFPQSHREFTALIDKLPTSVNVDLVHQGQKQTINYTADAPIAHVQASDTATPDVSHPNSFTRSVYDVQGVPTSVQVALQGAQDITYSASSSVPQASFSTETLSDGVLQQQITAQANQIPTAIHVTNSTGADETKVTYDADAVLGSVQLSMYDLAQDRTNLVASAFAIPMHIQFTQNKSAGVFDFLANAGIGVINVDFTRGGGTVIPLAGDHATLHKVGNAIGLQAQLTGFKSAHFDGSQKTIVSVGLDPGGQEFNALADLDSPNIFAKAHVSALPSSMTVTLDPVGGSVTYSASSIIPELDGSFLQRDTQTYGAFTLNGLPKNITLTFNTTGAAPEITYEADSRLGSIDGVYIKAPGDLAFHATISDLPQYMKIHGQDPISFDARTSSAAAVGSSYLGQVLFQYATNGVFESPPTTDDHIYLKTSGDQTHAELLYTGLKFLSVSTANQELHAEIRNVSDRLVRAYLTTDNLTATGFIDKVPATVKIDQVGNDIQYHASAGIAEIYTNVQRTNGDSLTADVTDVPTFIDVLFDAANSKITWTASQATGGISVLAHLTPSTLGTTRAFDGVLTISDIPTSWFVSYPDGNVDFEAGGTGIGSIVAKVSNHGAFNTLPGDHLNAYFNQNTGDLDASLHISNLKKAAFSKLTDGSGGGFVADLNMGNHGVFNLGAQIYLGTNQLVASGNFDHLPSTIHLRSDGGRIQYNGNDNPTLTLTVAAGDTTALGSTPLAPFVHGVSVRDGQSGTGKAVRANVYITGLPDSLDLNSVTGVYQVNNFHPSIDPLVVDVKLTTLADQPVSLYATQVVGTATPVSFTFGPFLSSTAGDGTHSLSINYNTTRDLGELTAEAIYGNSDDAKLDISAIPNSIAVNAALGAAQKSVNVTMSHGISDIKAWYKRVGQIDFTGSVHLHDVPSAVNLLLGRSQADDGNGKTVTTPDFTFTASDAGLDIDAYAAAELTDPADITAAAQLSITDLGKVVTGSLDGTSLHITSTPKTGSFELTAAGTININNIDLGFSAGPFVNTGTLDVQANIKQLSLGFQDMGDLRLDLGVTTGLTGDFSLFTLGEKSDTVIKVNDEFAFDVDLDVFGHVHVPIVTIDHAVFDLGDVVGSWHKNSNTEGFLGLLDLSALLAHCDIGINYRPKSEGDAPSSSLVLPAPPNDGHDPAAWLITPNPRIGSITLPSFALDVVAFFESPYGHDISPGINCDWGP
jgi:hypothetical protein